MLIQCYGFWTHIVTQNIKNPSTFLKFVFKSLVSRVRMFSSEKGCTLKHLKEEKGWSSEFSHVTRRTVSRRSGGPLSQNFKYKLAVAVWYRFRKLPACAIHDSQRKLQTNWSFRGFGGRCWFVEYRATHLTKSVFELGTETLAEYWTIMHFRKGICSKKLNPLTKRGKCSFFLKKLGNYVFLTFGAPPGRGDLGPNLKLQWEYMSVAHVWKLLLFQNALEGKKLLLKWLLRIFGVERTICSTLTSNVEESDLGLQFSILTVTVNVIHF